MGRGASRRGDELSDAELAEARAALAAARSVLVLTGAGVSAESGVPTFRGPDGLWRSHRPEELATPKAFARDPRLVWEWYGWRRERVAACRPNAGHHALARWALGRAGVAIVTQNVDGLHEAAAREAADDPAAALPLELHGSIFRVRCTRCAHRASDRGTVSAASLPSCPACGSLLRPDIVWFGEALDPVVIERAFALAEAADVCLVAGTSAVVHPAASLPAVTAGAGGRVIEVNPDPTPLSVLARPALRGGSAVVLPELLAWGA
jgi:NAD-dependent deacetylase